MNTSHYNPIKRSILTLSLLVMPFGLFSQALFESSRSWQMLADSAPVVAERLLLQTFEKTEDDDLPYTTSTLNLVDGKVQNFPYPVFGGDSILFINEKNAYLYFNIESSIYSAYTDRSIVMKCAYATDASIFTDISYSDPRLAPMRLSHFKNNPFHEDTIPFTYGDTVKLNFSGVYLGIRTFTGILVDSVSLYGYVNAYSATRGSGNWSDTAVWTHSVPSVRRSALINHDLTVDCSMSCDTAFIGQGSLTIPQDVKLSAHHLYFESDESLTNGSLLSSGSIDVSGGVTVQKRFGEKGKWYFISLPFDVYSDGFSANMQLQDDTFTGSGNYFYLKRYDGEKRSLNGSGSGNWSVLPASGWSDDIPVMQAYHGYLIALDEAATQDTIAFFSRDSAAAETFGRSAAVTIPQNLNGGSSAVHNGWFLCGNPLPRPLPLRSIVQDANLGSEVYVYNGTSYEAIPFDSDSVIAPFSAFFVKVSGAATLSADLSQSGNVRSMMRMSCLSSGLEEPQCILTEHPEVRKQPVITLLKDRIRLEVTESSHVSLYSIDGRLIVTISAAPGSSCLPIPYERGVFIVVVRSRTSMIYKKLVH